MSLTKKQLAYLEELFADYYNYPKKIKLRKAELMVKHTDENIGGGKSNQVGSPIEKQVIKEQADEKLQFLVRCYEGVEFVRQYFDGSIAKVIDKKFFENLGLTSWADVGEDCNYSVSGIYKIRYRILELFGNYIGIVNTLDNKEGKK